MAVYKANFGHVIRVSLITFFFTSLALFYAVGTIIHFGYLLLLVLVIGYVAISYFSNRVVKITINESSGLFQVVFRERFSKDAFEIVSKEIKYKVGNKVGTRGFKRLKLFLFIGGKTLLLEGENGGWTNEAIEKIVSKIEKLQESEDSPKRHSDSSN